MDIDEPDDSVGGLSSLSEESTDEFLNDRSLLSNIAVTVAVKDDNPELGKKKRLKLMHECIKEIINLVNVNSNEKRRKLM